MINQLKRPSTWLGTATVVLAIGGSALAGPAVAAPAKDPVATIACKSATIGGAKKCIARGQFCAIRSQADYKRNGFTCKKDKAGRYRLS
jgi:uncharacterized membrane protein